MVPIETAEPGIPRASEQYAKARGAKCFGGRLECHINSRHVLGYRYSAAKVRDSTELVQTSGNQRQRIARSVTDLNGLVGQINQALIHMDGVKQQNAALAEEAAATSAPDALPVVMRSAKTFKRSKRLAPGQSCQIARHCSCGQWLHCPGPMGSLHRQPV